MTKFDFRIVKDKDKWVVARKDDVYDHHAHFHRKDACYKLIRLIEKGLLPKETYFREAAKRLTSPEEFALLRDKHKTQYYNHAKARYPNNRRCV